MITFSEEVFEKVIGNSFDNGGVEVLQILETRLRWWWTPRKMRKEIERIRRAIVNSSLGKPE